jgi:hypothetical protein
VTVEKGGWLDQLLAAVLGFLTNPWLSAVVAFVGAAVVACLARLSPKKDWDYIKEGPGRFLFFAFILFYGAQVGVPRYVPPVYDFACSTPDSGCDVVAKPGYFAYDYTAGNFWRDLGISFLQDLIVGGLGVLVGIVVARAVLARRSEVR